jgi:hypothetical protein
MKKNWKYVKSLSRRKVATPSEDNSLTKIFENEYFLMVGLNSVTYEDIEVWFVASGSSCHIIGMRSIFITFSDINTNFYVGYGTDTIQAIRGFEYVRF